MTGLLGCLASDVDYFGKREPLSAVETAERAYHTRFRIRNNTVTDFNVAKEDAQRVGQDTVQSQDQSRR